MAQGALKSHKPSTPSRRPSTGKTSKGKRSIAPKKKELVKRAKITKKYTAGLTEKTERALAERAGHLEMLRGGKKGKGGGEGEGEGDREKK